MKWVLVFGVLFLGCEAQIPLGNHTQAMAFRASTVTIDQGALALVGQVPVSVRIRRAPKPWGLHLIAEVQTGEGMTVDAREGDYLPIGGQSWRVISVRAQLREGALLKPQMDLVLER